MSELSAFRERMKSVRKRKGITLREIADKIDVKEATVQRYESGNGIKSVPYESIVGIANVLNVSPAYLMGWEDNLNENVADEIVDLLKDQELLSYIKKIQTLKHEDRQMVYSMVDRLCE